MPSDVGRAWDDLMRRHWRGLWAPANGKEADGARDALKAFFGAMQEELSRQRHDLEELRGEARRPHEAPERIPEKIPAKVVAPPAASPSRPVLAAAVLEPKDRQELEQALGYRFRNPRVLEEALAHPSFTYENPEIGLPSNYRLAFLGDALLGFLVADALHGTLPEADQAVLTERRKHVVSRPALGRTADRLGVGPHLILGRGIEREGRRNRTILAETMEALVAAIYLDGGLEAAKAFVRRLMGGEFGGPPPKAEAPKPAAPGRRRRPRGRRGGRGRSRPRSSP